MRYLLTHQEREKLYGLRWLDRIIYLELRFRMDFKTGYVGVYPKLSYQALREAAYIEEGAGKRDSGTPSIGKIRRSLERLIKSGLITRHSTSTQLIFELAHAERDFQGQNKKHRFATSDQIGSQITPRIKKSTVKSAYYDNPSLLTCDKPGRGEIAQLRTPLRSEKKNKYTLTPPKKNSPISLPENFVPNQKIISQALTLGCQSAASEETIAHFRSYQTANNRTSSDWDAAYLSWLLMGKQLGFGKTQQTRSKSHEKNNTAQARRDVSGTRGSLITGHHDLSDFDWSTPAANDDCYEDPLDEI